jgi:hypothetical protein
MSWCLVGSEMCIRDRNELEIVRAMIFRWRDAATKRLASGDSLVKSPTRLAFLTLLPRLSVPIREILFTLPTALGSTDFAGRFGSDLTFEAGARFCSRFAAIGVTEAGVFGKPLLPPLADGPGRFNLVLECL